MTSKPATRRVLRFREGEKAVRRRGGHDVNMAARQRASALIPITGEEREQRQQQYSGR